MLRTSYMPKCLLSESAPVQTNLYVDTILGFGGAAFGQHVGGEFAANFRSHVHVGGFGLQHQELGHFGLPAVPGQDDIWAHFRGHRRLFKEKGVYDAHSYEKKFCDFL